MSPAQYESNLKRAECSTDNLCGQHWLSSIRQLLSAPTVFPSLRFAPVKVPTATVRMFWRYSRGSDLALSCGSARLHNPALTVRVENAFFLHDHPRAGYVPESWRVGM